MTKRALKPFMNETDSMMIGGLTIENRTDHISIYGALHLTRDRMGLGHARNLRGLLDSVIDALERDPSLPDTIPPPKPVRTIKNPFS
jgi:hypothetical protein